MESLTRVGSGSISHCGNGCSSDPCAPGDVNSRRGKDRHGGGYGDERATHRGPEQRRAIAYSDPSEARTREPDRLKSAIGRDNSGGAAAVKPSGPAGIACATEHEVARPVVFDLARETVPAENPSRAGARTGRRFRSIGTEKPDDIGVKRVRGGRHHRGPVPDFPDLDRRAGLGTTPAYRSSRQILRPEFFLRPDGGKLDSHQGNAPTIPSA
jgi:hypothetical protein